MKRGELRVSNYRKFIAALSNKERVRIIRPHSCIFIDHNGLTYVRDGAIQLSVKTRGYTAAWRDAAERLGYGK
jgi:hypothetical protein